MKLAPVLLALCLVAPAIAQMQSSAASAAINQNQNAQKAAKIINQTIQALGGPAYLNLQDMQANGRAYGFYHNESQGAGTPFWLFWKAPDLERVELTKQRDVIEIHRGTQGYEITYKGTAPEDPKDNKEYARAHAYSLRNVLTHWFTDPTTALFYDGPSFTENHGVDQVSLMNKQNQSVTLYLDQATHLPVKLSYTVRDESGYRDTYAEVYDNYQTFQGIPTALNITRSKNGEMTTQRFMQRATYNAGLADSLFDAKVSYDPNAKSKPKPR